MLLSFKLSPQRFVNLQLGCRSSAATSAKSAAVPQRSPGFCSLVAEAMEQRHVSLMDDPSMDFSLLGLFADSTTQRFFCLNLSLSLSHSHSHSHSLSLSLFLANSSRHVCPPFADVLSIGILVQIRRCCGFLRRTKRSFVRGSEVSAAACIAFLDHQRSWNSRTGWKQLRRFDSVDPREDLFGIFWLSEASLAAIMISAHVRLLRQLWLEETSTSWRPHRQQKRGRWIKNRR